MPDLAPKPALCHSHRRNPSIITHISPTRVGYVVKVLSYSIAANLILPLVPKFTSTIDDLHTTRKHLSEYERQFPMSPAGNLVTGDDTTPDQTMITAQQNEVELVERHSKTGSALLKVPPELRAMIYEPLIEAEDLSILRVSK